MSERRNGLARGVSNRLSADGCSSDRAMLNNGKFSAYRTGIGTNPADLYIQQDESREPLRGANLFSRKGDSKEVGNSKLRRFFGSWATRFRGAEVAADLCMRQDDDGDMGFAHGTSAQGHCVQQEGGSKEVENSKLRRFLAHGLRVSGGQKLRRGAIF